MNGTINGPVRIPPHSFEMERAVLGAILLEGREALTTVTDRLRPSDFYKDAHRVVYEAMQRLLAQGAPVDVLTLQEDLLRHNELALAGGPSLIAQLVEEGAVAANLSSYVDYVRDQAVLRELIGASGRFTASAFEARDPHTLVPRFWDEIGVLNARLAAWPPPSPIPNGLLPVPRLEGGMVPDGLANWVMDIADRTQCPPDVNGHPRRATQGHPC